MRRGPAPSQSNEDRAREIAEHAGIDMMDDHDLFIAEMSTALAEAALAEKERCAKWHDDRARQTPDAFEMEFHQVSAAAIRAGLTADDWLAAALSHLLPAPSQSDEELWRDLCERDDRTSPAEWPDMALVTREEYISALVAVRDEATLAEKERCAKVAEDVERKCGRFNGTPSAIRGEK